MKFHSDQVKVTFYEAKNQKGQDFHTDHADTYQVSVVLDRAGSGSAELTM